MGSVSQLILTVVLNASWQIVLILVFVSVCSRLMRRFAASYQHVLWVAALILCFFLPLVTSSTRASAGLAGNQSGPQIALDRVEVTPAAPIVARPVTANNAGTTVSISGILALVFLSLYFLVFFQRCAKLARSWWRTREIAHRAHPIEPGAPARQVFEKWRALIGIKRARILCSEAVPVPITVGIREPLVVLPERLCNCADEELLTAAIGHELIHISRRDYLLNLIYELISVPISFHPAAALIKRRISQTRELCCDERVAERVLSPQAYARSLVQLASSAPPLSRLAFTTTVGIADADILEVRIMSLLGKSQLGVGRKKPVFFATCLLLAIPCLAAAAFALRLDIDGQHSNVTQETQEAKERKEREAQKRSAQTREESERAEREGTRYYQELESGIRLRRMREGEELRMKLAQRAEQAELAKKARIPTDQAIQIAISQQPGKVIGASLENSQEAGVLYHLIIIDTETPTRGAAHVWVSAIDGRVVNTEREAFKEQNPTLERERSMDGGNLNGRAISLPSPEYSALARQTRVSGTVGVEVDIDEQGKVISARAVSGHPLLRGAAVAAGMEARFAPTLLDGQPVKVKGIITYKFVAQ